MTKVIKFPGSSGRQRKKPRTAPVPFRRRQRHATISLQATAKAKALAKFTREIRALGDSVVAQKSKLVLARREKSPKIALSAEKSVRLAEKQLLQKRVEMLKFFAAHKEMWREVGVFSEEQAAREIGELQKQIEEKEKQIAQIEEQMKFRVRKPKQ